MKFNSFDEITEKELEELYLYRVEAIEKLYSNLSNEKKICMIEAETKLFCEADMMKKQIHVNLDHMFLNYQFYDTIKDVY